MYCRVIKSSIFLAFIFLALPKVLAATEGEFTPYIGGDMQIQTMDFKKGFGDDLFKKKSMQGNLYLGFKVNKYFGFEIGHQVADKKEKNILTSGETHLGDVRQNVDPGWRETGTRQIKGWNLNAVGFLPISNEYRVSVIGLTGLSILEVKLKDTWIWPAAGNLHLQEQVKFKKRKNVLRVGCGLQKMFTNALGIRTTMVFENTARFNNISQNYSDKNYRVKLKNSWTYGIGMFIMF